MLLKPAILVLTVITSVWAKCEDPEIISKTYTTQDATILTHIAYISEFSVKCSSGSVENLYALLNGAVTPVGYIDSNKYQISWTEEVKTARTGDISVKVFDEDGYTLLKKAQRASETLENVQALGNVVISHPGSYKGPWISCECLAVAVSLIVSYYAIHFRAKLLS